MFGVFPALVVKRGCLVGPVSSVAVPSMTWYTSLRFVLGDRAFSGDSALGLPAGHYGDGRRAIVRSLSRFHRESGSQTEDLRKLTLRPARR